MSLPPQWLRYTTDEGKEYYHNVVTNTTQWEPPPMLEAVPLDNFGSSSSEGVYQYNPSASDLVQPTTPSVPSGPMMSMVEMHTQGGASGPDRLESEIVSLNAEAPQATPGVIGVGSGGGAQGSSSSSGGGAFSLGGLVASAAMSAIGASSQASGADDSNPGLSGWFLASTQKLFDVSTNDIVQRLRVVLLPYPKPPVDVKEDMRSRPDFYGPFWVATTAVLFLAATGNFARLVALGDHHQFKPDYGLISIAATMIYGCLVAVPLVARGALFFAGAEAGNNIDFRQIVCVCGYAMTPMIPVSLLCLIPMSAWRWLVTFIGLAASLYFLREHLLADIQVTAPGPKMALTWGPCITQVVIFFIYRVHFF